MSTNTALQPQTLTLDRSHFELTERGLVIRNDPSFEECENALSFFKKVNEVSHFAIGDILNHMETRWGETYTQAVDAFDYSVRSLANIKSVAKAFPSSRRRENIPFSYYQSLQGLPEEQQEELLDRVEEEGMTLQHVRNKVRILKHENKSESAECRHKLVLVCEKCGEMIEG